jgi:hypothetical protein
VNLSECCGNGVEGERGATSEARSARYASRSAHYYLPSATRFAAVARIPLAMMRCVQPSMIVARALSVVAKRRES